MQVLGGVYKLPGGPGVFGAVDAALLRLYGGPHAPRLRGRHGHADSPLDAGRQAGIVRYLRPGIAAISRLVQPAIGPTAVYGPEVAPDLPDGGVEDAGVGGVHGQVDGAGILALEQDLLPRFPSVGRAEDTALLVRPEGVPQGRDIDYVGIIGVYPDAAYVTGVL